MTEPCPHEVWSWDDRGNHWCRECNLWHDFPHGPGQFATQCADRDGRNALKETPMTLVPPFDIRERIAAEHGHPGIYAEFRPGWVRPEKVQLICTVCGQVEWRLVKAIPPSIQEAFNSLGLPQTPLTFWAMDKVGIYHNCPSEMSVGGKLRGSCGKRIFPPMRPLPGGVQVCAACVDELR